MASGYQLSSYDLQQRAMAMANLWKGVLWTTNGYLQRLIDVGNSAISTAYFNGGSTTWIQDLVDLSNATAAMTNVVNYASHVGVVSMTDNTGGAGISSPAAPTITPQGTTGSTTYYYQVIAHTLNGTTAGFTGTPPGTNVGSTTTGNSTLSATNYNLLTNYAVTGAISYDILKWNGSAWQTLGNTTASAFGDAGQAGSAYVVPSTNTTAGTTQTVSVPNGSFCVVTSDATLVSVLKPIGTDQTPAIRKPSDLTAGNT